jgi:hypothetical protein
LEEIEIKISYRVTLIIFWLVKNQFRLRVVNLSQLLVLELRVQRGKEEAMGKFTESLEGR